MCDDGAIYYCKYLVSVDRKELNCLLYELVATRLLTQLQLPTPEVSLVKITDGTLVKSKIESNKRLKVGNTCFGSKEVPFANEIQSIQAFNKPFLNSIENLEDLIRIAILDLWMQNTDRGRNLGSGYNYNLLLKPEGKCNQLMAFDHAFTFGGVHLLGMFNVKMNSYTNNLLQTPFYKAACKHIGKSNSFKIVEDFIPLLSQNFSNEISAIFKAVDKEWNLFPNSDRKIIDFLSDTSHITNCHRLALQSLK